MPEYPTQEQIKQWVLKTEGGMSRTFAEQMVRFGVEWEREQCARILDGVNNHDNPLTARDCAHAIRDRSST